MVSKQGISLAVEALRRRYMDALAEPGPDVDRDSVRHQLLEVLHKTARLLEQDGRLKEALIEYERLFHIDPTANGALSRACELARRVGDIERHRTYLERLAVNSVEPREQALRYYESGLVAQRHGDDRGAVESFGRALSALPTFTPAIARLSRFARARGDEEQVKARFVAEIDHLESLVRHAGEGQADERAKDGLLRRYLRLARILKENGESAGEMALYKRALSLEPDCVPALLELKSMFRRLKRWEELVSLILGWVQRTKLGKHQSVSLLLEAADVTRVYLRDDEGAARIYARVITLQPDHAYALSRARQVFARFGGAAHLVEIERRMGDAVTAHARVMHLVQAGQIQEADGEPVGAASEAVPYYEDALTSNAAPLPALEGLVRTGAVLGTGHFLLASDARERLVTTQEPTVLFGAVDLLIRHDRHTDALQLLDEWVGQLGGLEQLDVTVRQNVSLFRYAIWQDMGKWHRVIDELLVLSSESPPSVRAAALFRAGYIEEVMCCGHENAVRHYRDALEAETDFLPARQGLFRLTSLQSDGSEPSTHTPPQSKMSVLS